MSKSEHGRRRVFQAVQDLSRIGIPGEGEGVHERAGDGAGANQAEHAEPADHWVDKLRQDGRDRGRERLTRHHQPVVLARVPARKKYR